jgi:transposase
MARCLTVAPHLPRPELEARYRQERDSVARTHWHILWLVAQGHRCPHVAALVGYSVEWVRTVVHRYNTAGPAGVGDRRHANPGAAPLLASEHRDALREAVGGPAPDGGLWTGRKVAAWMSAQLGRPVGEQRGWEYLRRLGFTPQRPRPRATRADPDAQAAFKKGGSKPRSMR